MDRRPHRDARLGIKLHIDFAVAAERVVNEREAAIAQGDDRIDRIVICQFDEGWARKVSELVQIQESDGVHAVVMEDDQQAPVGQLRRDHGVGGREGEVGQDVGGVVDFEQ